MDIWRAVANGQEYFLATQDPMNYVYASWIYHLSTVKGITPHYNNCERLGDLVEAGLGVLYLATIFPEASSNIVKEPGVMWRRIETSMTYKVKWADPPNFGTSTGQCAPSLVTTDAVEPYRIIYRQIHRWMQEE